MRDQKENVAGFFDKAAAAYQEKNYGGKRIFLSFFFNERLTEATKDIDFENKSILDIGAGTGSLYNYISEKSKNFNYYGTDISREMLENSNIPPEKRLFGNSYDQVYDVENFDFIYMLGVITYLDKEEFNRILMFVKDKLAKDSLLIVTFNNKPSLAFYTTRILAPVMRLFGPKNKVIAQKIVIKYYKLKEFEMLLKNFSLQIVKQVPLNQTIYPLNNIAPRFFIRFSAFIKRNISRLSTLRFLSSDVLLYIKTAAGEK